MKFDEEKILTATVVVLTLFMIILIVWVMLFWPKIGYCYEVEEPWHAGECIEQYVGNTFSICLGEDEYGRYYEVLDLVDDDSLLIETDKFNRLRELIYDLKQFKKIVREGVE